MYYNKLMDDPPISGQIKRLFPCSNSNTWFDLCPLPFATAVLVAKSGGRSQGQFTAQWLCAAEQGYCEHCDCCATDHGTSCSCCEAPGHERESTLHHLRRRGTTRHAARARLRETIRTSITNSNQKIQLALRGPTGM